MEIIINKKKTLERIKPLHAVGCGPKSGMGGAADIDASELFREIGIPSCRLHDIEYPYGSNQYVDIHCIFPNFDADENDEHNYNFAATDKYILAIKGVDADVFYRLGESIDHFGEKLYVRPPKDMHKWARICEHIIRHYNQGWANGLYLGIKHWEIWNEPEGRSMWCGTYPEFYELYSITAKHLKECFPDIMVGGYGCLGVYSEVRDHGHERYNPTLFNRLIPFMEGFFDYIKKTEAPLDFFSWHIYTLSPEEVAAAAKFVRGYLDARGYERTKSYLTELNYSYALRIRPTIHQHTEFPADILSAMILGQSAPVDMIFYYDLGLRSWYNCVYFFDNMDGELKKLNGFAPMKFFGDLYRLGTRMEAVYEENKGIYALAASDGESIGVAIASRGFDGTLDVIIDAKCATVTAQSGSNPSTEQNISLSNGKITLDVKKEEIYYISYRK